MSSELIASSRAHSDPPGSLVDQQRDMLQGVCPDQKFRIAIRHPHLHVRKRGCADAERPFHHRLAGADRRVGQFALAGRLEGTTADTIEQRFRQHERHVGACVEIALRQGIANRHRHAEGPLVRHDAIALAGERDGAREGEATSRIVDDQQAIAEERAPQNAGERRFWAKLAAIVPGDDLEIASDEAAECNGCQANGPDF
ncbi:hypothetical protein WR25_24562 [Diploscapter pachys]|uniref:Uncharacterized protein n=1 Tax=Diploscapter pachys TaxID=2018661 RepID=A0A2A2KG64_9BILA|nr:hypothetical protein WR25_24562 [Diploscapter pachys]